MHQIKDQRGQDISPEVVLASASPRRRELLDQLGIRATVAPADLDEQTRAGESPADYVERLACAKALAVAEGVERGLVIGADTTIALDGLILGKPENEKHAFDMLSSMAGREHLVHTGVAVASGGRVESIVVTTLVEFLPMTRKDIENYLQTREPFGKAGAYAIQGVGAILVKKIAGSYSNVVGLPLAETAMLLKRFGYFVLAQRSAACSGT